MNTFFSIHCIYLLNAFISEEVFSKLLIGFHTGSRNCRKRPVLRACLLRRSARDTVSSRGDGSERGGCTRPREADLASTAAGGYDYTALSSVHGLPALRENTAAGTDAVMKDNQLDQKIRNLSLLLCFCARMIAGWFWQNRRSTGYWRRCRNSSSSLQSWPITFSWMLASLLLSLRYCRSYRSLLTEKEMHVSIVQDTFYNLIYKLNKIA